MKNILLIFACLSLNACSELNKRFGMAKPTITEEGAIAYAVTPYGNKIIVAMGQSNIVGRGQTELFPVHSRVNLTRDIPTGPAYYAASKFAEQLPQWDIKLVQCAEGGTAIEQWVKGGDRYERCVKETREAMIEGGQVVGIMFYQGEADTRDRLNQNWPEQFMGLVKDFRVDIGIADLPIVWAQLGAIGGESLTPKEVQNNWTTFKTNQLRVNIPFSNMIVTDDQPVVDDVHHGYEANIVIGERFYYALLNLLSIE